MESSLTTEDMLTALLATNKEDLQEFLLAVTDNSQQIGLLKFSELRMT